MVMPLTPFPNVPQVPGVPQVPRSPQVSAAVPAGLGIIEGALWRSLQVETRWGIYDSNGNSLVDNSALQGLPQAFLQSIGGLPGMSSATYSTGSVDYSKEMKTSDFPIEQGGFASYNKVETPSAPVVTLCMCGNEGQRKQFLNTIDTATKSTNLYTIVTPEVSYIGYSIDRYDYQRRSDHGVTLLIVTLGLKEIRQVSAQYTKVTNPNIGDTNPSATPAVDNGNHQAQPTTSALFDLVNKFFTALNKLQSAP